MTYTKPEPGHPVLLELDGRKLELRFSLRSLKELDTDAGISVLKGDGLADVLRDPLKLAVMLYYGVRGKAPDITLDWIEDNVDASMLLDLAPMLAYACTGRWPDLSKLLPNAARPAAESETGSASGPLVATTSDVLN